ncbi:Disease resistance protein TAO1 [Linum perenne]
MSWNRGVGSTCRHEGREMKEMEVKKEKRSEYHGPWEYDVFLCFRGETRTSFTSHVMAALSEKKIRTFIDTMLGKGNSITDLLSVLKRSALSVIIFSERFAESTWCLDEVATISRSMKEFGHRVLPVFYNVDPSEVDGETGSYAAMIESQDGSKYPPSVKMKWRSALKEVVDKAGLTSCEIRHDSQLIKAIVDNVWKELVDMSPRLKPKNLIGMDSRVWEWDGFPSSLLPSKFSPHNIVQIRIRHSPLTQCWDGVQDFVNLRWFDLSYCKNLTIVPDLSKATHLESLKLAGCKSIVELPSFVEYLDKLITLDVGACENLEILPPKLGSKHLKHVIISNCRKIKQCPELVSNWDNLDLHGTPITTLPSSIYSVKQAQTLYLHGQSITTFPQFSPTLKGFYLCHTAIEKLPHQRPSDSSKYNLPRIAQLQLIENSKLVKFSRNIWNIVTTELIIIGSPMLEMLPEIPENPTARDLRVLVVEQCKTFKRLPSSINILKSLEVLSLTGAAIRLMPLCIQDLEQLRTLDMSHCKSLESLPSTISMLGRLSQIYLVGCLSLRSLPELPQSVKTLAAGNCKSLQAVSSSNFRKLHFRHLSFVGCNQLDEKLLGQLMAKLPRHDATSLHPTTVLYPGSELPEWFAYKSMGDSVTFPLPKNSKRLKGISFAAVYALGASNDKDEDIHLHMKCDCFIKPAGSHGCASDDVGVVEKWIVCMSNFHDCVSTDHVFLWSDHKPEPTLSSSGENDEYEGGEAWYVKYSGMDLSFRFSTDVKRGDIKHCKIKRCGVSLAFHTVGNL